METTADPRQTDQTPTEPPGQPFLRPWIPPAFERGNLKDALSSGANFDITDGPDYYSS
ncbi:MAG: hypothetical protein QG637_1121 [Chloroflexota bacterium]|nr:hypothetical protein [Chloroflexota bacterium]